MKNNSVINKYAGLSFSEASEKISKKWKDRETNPQSMKSFHFEMGQLVKHQKMKQQEVEGMYMNGGKLKYNTGGNLDPLIATAQMLYNAQQVGQDLVSTGIGTSDYNSSKNRMIAPAPLPAPSINVQQGRVGTPERLPMLPISVTSDRALDMSLQPYMYGTQSEQPVVQDDGTGGSNIYTPLAVGKGLEFLGKAGLLATGYDKAMPQYNPNEARTEALMANRSINTQAQENLALSQQNAALDSLSDIRSANVKRALTQNVIQSTLKSIQQNRMQQDQINNQYAGEYASTLNNLGQQRVQADLYADQQNQLGKANMEQGFQNLLESLGGAGQEITRNNVNIAQQELISKFLSTANFKAGSAEELIRKTVNKQPITETDFIKVANDNGKTVEEVKSYYNQWLEGLNSGF